MSNKIILFSLSILLCLGGCSQRKNIGDGFSYVVCNDQEKIITLNESEIVIFPNIVEYAFNEKNIWGCTEKIRLDGNLWESDPDYVFGYFLAEKSANKFNQGLTEKEFSYNSNLLEIPFENMVEKCRKYGLP